MKWSIRRSGNILKRVVNIGKISLIVIDIVIERDNVVSGFTRTVNRNLFFGTVGHKTNHLHPIGDVGCKSFEHRSNQNFLLFQSATDPSPVFAGNYYDYNEFRANVPFFLNLTKKWALSTGLDYQFRDYLSRQPRTAANTFDTGTQKNNMFTFNLGIRKKLNDVSALTLTYGSVVATSNNHFERYLPYNYSGQSISLGYQLTY
jgi:hypothetical protein